MSTGSLAARVSWRRVVIPLVGLLLVVQAWSLPAAGVHACPCTVEETEAVAGNTFVFKLTVPEGAQADILPCSHVTLTGTLPSLAPDLATGLTLTDGTGSTSMAIAASRAGTLDGEVRAAVATGQGLGQEVHLGAPFPGFSGGTVNWRIQIGNLPSGDWFFVLSVPQFPQLDVEVSLLSDQPIEYTRGPDSDSAWFANAEDTTGPFNAQLTRSSVHVLQSASTPSPAGEHAFAMLGLAQETQAAGTYAIDGPGGADDRAFSPQVEAPEWLGVSTPEPTAFVPLGPPGTYTFDVEALVATGQLVPGPIGYLHSADLSF